MRRLAVVLFVVAFLLGLGWAASAATSDVSIPWWTVDGGGGNVSGGGFTLCGTLGQPDAGLLSGGSYTLIGGFWDGNQTGNGGSYRVYLPLVLKHQ